MKTLAALILIALVSACSHPLEIIGEGDILSSTGKNDCLLEDQPCSNIVANDYIVTYTASPRPGWHFVEWQNCVDQFPDCSVEMPAEWVNQFWFQTAPPLRAVFAKSDPVSGLGLLINEVVASNGSTLADEDGDFEDWIELYNDSHDAIDLTGWGLSDNPANPFKWTFPPGSWIASGEFMLVWASGKNRVDPTGPLHTNYSISAAGEDIVLTRPDNELVDFLPAVALPRDISVGRVPGGGDEWRFFDEPTPLGPNLTTAYLGVLEPPVFSQPAGFYTAGIEVTIEHPDALATLHYTVDGNQPTTAANTYVSSLFLDDRSMQENFWSAIPVTPEWEPGMPLWVQPRGIAPNVVSKATVLRAQAHRAGYIPAETTATYFVYPEGSERYSLPVVSLSVNFEDLYSEEIGLFVPGVNYDPDRPDPLGSGNPFQRGDDWERPASLEFFETDGSLALAQNVGIRIHGGASRRFPRKSLRVYARGQYGNSNLDYPFFPDQHYSSYRRLILRNSGQDWMRTLVRDAIAHSLVRDFNFDTQAYRPSIVFLNGEYWGIHDIRERYDRHYLARVYGIDPDNIDLLSGRRAVEEGDAIHWNETVALAVASDLSQPAAMAEIEQRIDLDNLIDYYSAQIYFTNNDWPQNNISFWRSRVPYNASAPVGHDGRWRWLLFDLDRFNGTSPELDMVAWTTAELNPRNNQAWPNLVLRNLLENDGFRQDFINRMADHLNSAFRPSVVDAAITRLKLPLEPEMPEHIGRWVWPNNLVVWENLLNDLRNFAVQRPDFMRAHIQTNLAAGAPRNLTVDVADSAMGRVRVNSLTVTPDLPGLDNPAAPYPWTGVYFAQVPVTIEAIAAPGFLFSHWEGAGIGEPLTASQSLTLTADMAVTAHFVVVDGPDPEPPSPDSFGDIVMPPAGSTFAIAQQTSLMGWYLTTGSAGGTVVYDPAGSLSGGGYFQFNALGTGYGASKLEQCVPVSDSESFDISYAVYAETPTPNATGLAVRINPNFYANLEDCLDAQRTDSGGARLSAGGARPNADLDFALGASNGQQWISRSPNEAANLRYTPVDIPTGTQYMNLSLRARDNSGLAPAPVLRLGAVSVSLTGGALNRVLNGDFSHLDLPDGSLLEAASGVWLVDRDGDPTLGAAAGPAYFALAGDNVFYFTSLSGNFGANSLEQCMPLEDSTVRPTVYTYSPRPHPDLNLRLNVDFFLDAACAVPAPGVARIREDFVVNADAGAWAVHTTVNARPPAVYGAATHALYSIRGRDRSGPANGPGEFPRALFVDDVSLTTGVAAPVVHPPSADFVGEVTVTLEAGSPDAVIYYTVDGTDPDSGSAVLASGDTLILTSSTTLKARAAINGELSPIRTAHFEAVTLQ